MKIVNKVEINSSPERVFFWLENPERARQWVTNVTRTEYIKETPERIGTTFREYVEESGEGIEMKGIITDFQPNRIFGVHLESESHTADVRFVLSALGGGTLLSQEVELHFKLELEESVYDSIRNNIIAQAKLEFGQLKKLCEQDN